MGPGRVHDAGARRGQRVWNLQLRVVSPGDVATHERRHRLVFMHIPLENGRNIGLLNE